MFYSKKIESDSKNPILFEREYEITFYPVHQTAQQGNQEKHRSSRQGR